MKRRATLILVALSFSLSGTVGCTAQAKYAQYIGDYQFEPDKVMTIAPFDELGPDALVFTDFETGRIGLLTPTSESTSTAGPGLMVNSPVEIKITFQKNKEGEVTGLAWEQNGEPTRTATKIKLGREDVSFRSGSAVLSG